MVSGAVFFRCLLFKLYQKVLKTLTVEEEFIGRQPRDNENKVLEMFQI